MTIYTVLFTPSISLVNASAILEKLYNFEIINEKLAKDIRCRTRRIIHSTIPYLTFCSTTIKHSSFRADQAQVRTA